MLGGYLEFFMNPALADTYLRLKKELEELIQKKVIILLCFGNCLNGWEGGCQVGCNKHSLGNGFWVFSELVLGNENESQRWQAQVRLI